MFIFDSAGWCSVVHFVFDMDLIAGILYIAANMDFVAVSDAACESSIILT